MQSKESQVDVEQTSEFTFLLNFQITWLHSDSGKWSKIREDNTAKTACQLKEEEGLI